MITRTFKLCLNAGTGSAPYINVNQYDEGETWLFELYTEQGERYLPTTGAIVGIKSDGHGIANTGTVDSNGRVVITETQQMTAAAGKAEFELLIENQSHGTANFVVDVEQRAGENAIPSESDLSLFQEAVNSSQEILDIIGDTDLEEVVKDDIDAWLDDHPEATTTVEDGAITKAKLNEEVLTGDFLQMSVGKADVAESAEQLLSETGVTDKVPYNFRTAGGSADIGDRLTEKIVGGTVAWNQQLKNGNFADGKQHWTGSSSTLTTTDGVARLTITGAAWNNDIRQNTAKVIDGHVYLIGALVRQSSTDFSVTFRNPGGQSALNYFRGTEWTKYASFIKVTQSSPNGFSLTVREIGTALTNEWVEMQNVNCFDLTQMFGSAVADMIYAMETANAGSGVAFFRSLFPNAYYPYNAGELLSVEGLTSHDMTGFNQWDEEWEVGGISNATGAVYGANDRIRSKNFISCLPNTAYYFKTPAVLGTIAYYDADKVFISALSNDAGNTTRTTPSNAYFIKFCTTNMYGNVYNHDICINISSDRNGEYEAYEKHSYPLDSSLTLRGIPKLDASNNLYYDGDVYSADGTVQRKYGIVDLGTLNWVYDSTVPRLYSTGLAGAVKASGNTQLANIICSAYKTISIDTNEESIYRGGTGIAIGPTGTVNVRDTSYTDAATFKTAMSGVYLVYELATPTEETAEPYTEYQKVSAYGTEEYVSTSIVPVGHDTFYPQNLRKKIEDLPKDFSTLIAPTEKGFTATRNYTVNDLLIVNNVLYKVTANIANGGTITVNTNVQQTTLSALIKALS